MIFLFLFTESAGKEIGRSMRFFGPINLRFVFTENNSIWL